MNVNKKGFAFMYRRMKGGMDLPAVQGGINQLLLFPGPLGSIRGSRKNQESDCYKDEK
ncbi:MAG: hypothetical protein GY754_06130 [bacterium]|nr:hypothetical protein [bacterium]